MATKDIVLKRRLIKEGAILALLLALMCGGGMVLSNYDDDAESEKHAREGENDRLRADHNAVEQELGSGVEMNTFYKSYVRFRNGDLLLKRDTATQVMTMLHEKYHLINLSVSISPLTDVTVDIAPIKSGTLTKSEVHLTFGAVTDSAAYGFIEALESMLPGIVIVQDIKLTRIGDPSRNMLVGLSQHQLTPLVSVELNFTWLGIRPSGEEKSASSDSSGIKRPGNGP